MQMLERIWRRVQLMIAPARIVTGRDDGPVQFLQVKIGAEEVRDNTPRLSEFGFQSMPPDNSDAIVLFVAGDRSNAVIIATGNQALRFKNLKPGETAISDAFGKSIYLSKDGMVIEAAGKPVTVNNATTITINASEKIVANTPLLECTGDILDNSGTNARTMSQMRATYNDHDHTVTGIQTGSGSRITNKPNQLE